MLSTNPMRRPVLLTSAVLALLTACQGGGDAGTTEPPARPATTSAATTPDPAAVGLRAPVALTVEAGGVRRFGDGRALFAAYDPAADRTVVATTIGLVVQTGDGEAVTLSPDLPTALALSSDGRVAAVTTTAGHLQVWDVASEEQVASFDVAPDRFTSLQAAGPGFVAANDTEAVRFGVDGTSTTLVTAPGDATLGPAVVAAGTGDVAVPILTPVPTVATWSADGARTDIDLGLAEGSRVNGVRWSDDADHLAVLFAPPGAGDAMGIWDVGAGRFTGQVALPNFVAPSQVGFPTADRVVVPNLDRVVAYDLAGNEIDAFPTGESAVGAIDTAGGAVIVSRLDGTLTRWAPGTAPSELTPRTVTLVDHRGGAAVTVVDQVGLVRTFRDDGTAVRPLERWAVGEATAVDIAADGSLILATSTGAVRILDPSGQEVSAVLDRSQGDVSDVSIAPDDEHVATGVSVQKAAEAWDDTIEVTALGAAAAGFSLGGEAENVTGCSFYEANVVFSPDGALLASSSHDFTVQISPLDDPDATVVLEPHVGSVLDIEFSPDGATLLTSADDGAMRIWDVDGWRLRSELATNPGGWYSMAYSPDGSMLAVSDASGQIAIIDPTTAVVQRTFDGTRTALGDMVFTPDGRSILAPRADGSVGVWDVASGTIRDELRGHTMPVNGLAVSADGSMVVTASQDGTVRSFPLPSA